MNGPARLLCLTLLALLAAGCHRSDSPAPAAHGQRAEGEPTPGMRDLPRLEASDPGEPYVPTASEVPLTDDFTAAAGKRVTPDNYRLELVTIEKELDQLRASK